MNKKLIKYLSIAAVIILGILLVPRFIGGHTDKVRREIGESELYTREEINEMMDIVERTFRFTFNGCSMTELKYDEQFSRDRSAEWAEQYDSDRAVVLTSSFDVDSSGGDGSLNPNSTYTNWQWILTQSGNSKWVLRTWGYG